MVRRPSASAGPGGFANTAPAPAGGGGGLGGAGTGGGLFNATGATVTFKAQKPSSLRPPAPLQEIRPTAVAGGDGGQGAFAFGATGGQGNGGGDGGFGVGGNGGNGGAAAPESAAAWQWRHRVLHRYHRELHQ